MAEPAVQPAKEPATAGRPAIYRRWRAQRFSELVGQDPIVTTLRRAVAGDRLAHAYLFVGPRGTGKTSTARILAKAINCTQRDADGEPCDACPACTSIRDGRALDVIEIDAASHGLVEDARDLVMRALTAPSELARRVYIIDEVHMLSTHAFNALLKLIEEPPPHVVFVLATTDTHKVPATIVSRTQRFEFRRLAEPVIVEKLARICTAEQADADEEALLLIARLADGGMRDAESLLDQVLAFAGDRVTAELVREAVGLAEESAVAGLVDAMEAGELSSALGAIADLADAGRDMGQIAGQAELEARRRLLGSAADPARARKLAGILRQLAEAAGSGARDGRARLLLELLAADAPIASSPSVTATVPGTVAAARATPAATPTPAARPKPTARATPAATPTPEAKPDLPSPARGDSRRPELDQLRSRWAEVVEQATPVIKPLLKECRPVALDGARLTLAFPEGRDFLRSRIIERAGAVEQLLGGIFGGGWAIECVASNVELEPLSIEQAIAPDPDDPAGRALLEGVLQVTGGELVDAPEVR